MKDVLVGVICFAIGGLIAVGVIVWLNGWGRHGSVR